MRWEILPRINGQCKRNKKILSLILLTYRMKNSIQRDFDSLVSNHRQIIKSFLIPKFKFLITKFICNTFKQCDKILK